MPGKDLLMLRAILALLFAILYLIIGIPVLGIEWIIRKFNRQAAGLSQLLMVQGAFRVSLFICRHRSHQERHLDVHFPGGNTQQD